MKRRNSPQTPLTFHSAFFNNITYVSPKVPTLYTVMSSGDDATNAAVYGEFTHSFVLDYEQTIEIVVNNLGKCIQWQPQTQPPDPTPFLATLILISSI